MLTLCLGKRLMVQSSFNFNMRVKGKEANNTGRAGKMTETGAYVEKW